MVDRQVDGDFRDLDGSHHFVARVEQGLVFLVFGGGGVLAFGSRPALCGAERVDGLAQHGLTGSGEFCVVCAGGGEGVFGLRVWPAGDLLCAVA